jgi:hypothetical protein
MVNYQPIRYEDDEDGDPIPVFPSFGNSSLLLEVGLVKSLKTEFPDIPFRMEESGLDDTVEAWKEDQAENSDAEEIDDWGRHMDEISWTLVSADARLASQTCSQIKPGHLIVDKKRKTADKEVLLGPPSDDEEAKETLVKDEFRAPRVTIKTGFSNQPIELSYNVSELYTRWHSPETFYGKESGVVSSEIGGKRLTARFKRRQAYESRKKAEVQKNLDVLMSQASGSSSQVAPVIGSGMSQGSMLGSQPGSGGVDTGGSSRGNLKPKKKARKGF